MWLFFSVLAPFFWGFSNPVDAAIRRNWIKDDLFLTCLFALSKLPVAILLMILFWEGMAFGWPFFWMFFTGLLWMLGFVFYYRSLQIEEISRVILILQFQPIFILIIASMMIGESLTFAQLMAFLLILSGSVLAAIKKSEGKWHFSKAFIFILIADVIWSFADVMFKKFAIDFSSFFAAFSVDLLGSSLLGALLFVFPKYRNIYSNLKLPKRGWCLFLISAIFGVLGSLAFAYALTLGKAALTTVVVGLQPLFALICGLLLTLFIKEIPKESIKSTDLLIKGVSFLLIIIGLVALYFH